MTTRTETGGKAERRIENRDDLIAVFASGEKPREEWRIGTEHEKFVYRCADHRAPSYADPGGNGRYCGGTGYGASGLTDSDPVDRGGNGRGNGTGVSDSDTGYGSDPAGRGYSGRTDSDSGSNRDRAGHGRGPARG